MTAMESDGEKPGASWEALPAVAEARAEIAERMASLRLPHPAVRRETVQGYRRPSPGRRDRKRRERLPAPPPDIASIPDYSRLRRYAATPQELESVGAASVDALVDEVNRLAAAGSWPVAQGDFPRNRKLLLSLARRRDWLLANAR